MRVTRFTLLAFLAAASLPLTACDEPSQTKTNSYDVTGAVTTAAINSYGGDITVTAGAGDTIRVTETLRWTAAEPAPEHRLTGTNLTFTSGCQGLRGNCGVSYHLEVPAGVHATLDSAGGSITVRGLSGKLDLSSGGGALNATSITSAALDARSGGGLSHVDFAAPPSTVHIDSAGGDVNLQLPSERYAVATQADGGSATVGVAVDPASSHKIEVDTGGGSLLLTPNAGR